MCFLSSFPTPASASSRKLGKSAFPNPSSKLVAELEKRLKATIFIAAQRKIESKWVKKHRSQKRPFSRTLTAVYDALLEDLLTPLNIIGRRTRVRVDGTRLYKM